MVKLHILNLSHFPSRSTSKNVFLGLKSGARDGLPWGVLGIQMIFYLDAEKVMTIF